MARTCSICTHDDREAIDSALVNGTPFRDIAGRFDVSKSAVFRHSNEHLPATLVKAKDAEEVAHADGLLEQVQDLQTRTLAILAKAEDTDDHSTALRAIREARGNLELLGRLAGELYDQQTTVNVLVSPAWMQTRAVVLQALAPYPEARIAVAEALSDSA